MTDLSSTEYLAWLADGCRDMGNAAHQQPGASKYMRTLWKAEKALREVLDRREAEDWRDISTAPLTGDRVLVWRPTMRGGKGHIGVAYWASDQYAKNSRPFWSSVEGYISKTENRAHPPTHWRPLPAPPTTPTTESSHGE